MKNPNINILITIYYFVYYFQVVILENKVVKYIFINWILMPLISEQGIDAIVNYTETIINKTSQLYNMP